VRSVPGRAGPAGISRAPAIWATRLPRADHASGASPSRPVWPASAPFATTVTPVFFGEQKLGTVHVRHSWQVT